MSKRSRRRARGQPQPQLQPPSRATSPAPSAREPDRLLLDQIAAGELDPQLTAIAEAVRARVVELDQQTATVCVHRPIGRFKSSEIRCQPLVLDRLTAAA